jgi:hypothetical protein
VVGAEDPGETSQIRRSKNTEINLSKPQAIIRSRKNFDPKNIFDPKIDCSIILKSAFDARGGYMGAMTFCRLCTEASQTRPGRILVASRNRESKPGMRSGEAK